MAKQIAFIHLEYICAYKYDRRKGVHGGGEREVGYMGAAREQKETGGGWIYFSVEQKAASVLRRWEVSKHIYLL